MSIYWNFKPDIFFVDINMPGTDGLTLIRKIREEDPYCRTKFIIITGYDDFEHMREAIQSGIVDYLKKPIATGEFNKVVAAMDILIRQEKKERIPKKDNFILYEEYLRDPPQTVDGGTYIAVYSLNIELFTDVEKEIADLSNNDYLCLVFYGVDSLRLYYSPVPITRREIFIRFGAIIKGGAMSLVYTYPKTERLDLIVERIEQAMNRRFTGPVITECPEKGAAPSFDLRILDYAVEHGQSDSCRASLISCFNTAAGKDSFYSGLNALYRQIVLLLLNKYTMHQIQIPDFLKLELTLFSLCRYHTPESILAHLTGMTVSLAQKITNQGGNGELISGVCEFLERRYQENITLNYAADQFFVSPSYLSRRFKEKTGITFGKYLEDIRMDRALEYLINSQAPVADISKQVGYQDPAYFAKIFKQKYHLSPSEYRHKNRL
jgi:two-component system response regulator YesN